MSTVMQEIETAIGASKNELENLISKFEAMDSVEQGLKKSGESLATAAGSVSDASRSLEKLSKEAREILGSLGEVSEILKKADTGKLVQEMNTIRSSVDRTGEAVEKMRVSSREELEASVSAISKKQQEFQTGIGNEIQLLKKYHERTTLPAIQSVKKMIRIIGYFAIIAAAAGFALGYLL